MAALHNSYELMMGIGQLDGWEDVKETGAFRRFSWFFYCVFGIPRSWRGHGFGFRRETITLKKAGDPAMH